MVEFLATDQRLAADQRHVHGPVLLDEIHDPSDQLFSPKIAEVAQGRRAAQMLLAVGIATRAAQMGRLIPRSSRWSCQPAKPDDDCRGRRSRAILQQQDPARDLPWMAKRSQIPYQVS